MKLNDKFIGKVVFAKNGCIEWVNKSVFKGGYGKIYLSRNKTTGAHRYSYLKHVGYIPEGMCVCHKCDNTKCVNPDHLFIGTHAENMRDKWNKGRANVGSKIVVPDGLNVAVNLSVAKKRLSRGWDLKSAYETPPSEKSLHHKYETHGTDALYRKGCRCDNCRWYKRRIKNKTKKPLITA